MDEHEAHGKTILAWIEAQGLSRHPVGLSANKYSTYDRHFIGALSSNLYRVTMPVRMPISSKTAIQRHAILSNSDETNRFA